MSQEEPQKQQFNRMIIGAFLVMALVLTSVVVLKFVPLKYEEFHYNMESTIEAGEKESRWVSVQEGYTISGTYSVSDDNPAKVAFYPPETTFLLGLPASSYVMYSDESSSGSFSFQVETGGRYYVYVQNPASSGLFGWGAGPTITVTVEFKVSGYTTYL